MRYGVCGGPDLGPALKKAGFDYLESTVEHLLCPEAGDAEFDRRRKRHDACGLPVDVCGALYPRTVRLIGPNLARDAFLRRLDAVFDRARRAGLAVIVFGASSSRRIPDGFCRETAWKQLVALGREAGDRAAAAGLVCVVEPIHRAECNILTSLAETLTFVVEVDRPAVRAMVDAFHWAREREPEETIARARPPLAHAHVATGRNRRAPGLEPCDFDAFYRGLAGGGYDGRLSVEGGLPADTDDLADVLAHMKDALARARAAVPPPPAPDDEESTA